MMFDNDNENGKEGISSSTSTELLSVICYLYHAVS